MSGFLKIVRNRLSWLRSVCPMLLAAAFIFLPHTAGAVCESAAGEAVQITDGVRITLPGGKSSAALLDAYRASAVELAAESRIELCSDAAFSALYLIWDRTPMPWTLSTADGTESAAGENGFLHEVVRLPKAAKAVTLQLGAEDASLCDIYVFSEGTLPDWVQQWEPPLDGAADLLVMPTHADDEHLFFGGVLPTYAGERKLRVQVVYMTNHWKEAFRPHELLDGLWVVGVTAYPVIGPFPNSKSAVPGLDAAIRVYGYDEVLAFQVEMLRRFKPFVVVGHDLNGEYGHGAHMLNAHTLADALPLSGRMDVFESSFAQYGAWEVSKCYLHLYKENGVVMNWDIPLDAFGGATAYQMAELGFSKHVTQHKDFAMQRGGPHDCRKFGLVYTSVGPDLERNDLFENIDIPSARAGQQPIV